MGPGKPEKSWNFIVAFFQDWKVLENGYWSWKVKVNSSKKNEIC